MKRSVILILLLLAIGAFVLVPLLRDNGSSSTGEEAKVVSFNFRDDATPTGTYGEATPVSFDVDGSKVRKVELILDDTIIKTWNAPNGKISFGLDAGINGVGEKNLVLRAYLKSGGFIDESQVFAVRSDIDPLPLRAVVVSSTPHNPKNYTQGLEFNAGKLYEGTGNPQSSGESMIGILNMSTGEASPKNAIDATYFGEGITIMGDNLYQLTWQNGKCFVYDKNTIQIKPKEFTYAGEGWGLCNDGKYLIMSDGSNRITFRNPEDFSIVRTIEVFDNVGPRDKLNELEYIDGKIYANIYMTNNIVTIEPSTGRVLEQIDALALSDVGRMGGEVLNGIAYNPQTKKLYMTGKYWGKILEVKLEK